MIPNQASHLLHIPIATPELELEQEVNVYMLVNKGEALLVDAGYNAATSLQVIEKRWLSDGQPTVRALVVTHAHRDHVRAAPAVSERFQCPLLLHALDVPALCSDIQLHQGENDTPPHIVPLQDGDLIPFGDDALRVIHAPGHTLGHIHLWWDSQKMLFAGDNVLGAGSTWIGPPDGNLNDYLRTLAETLEWSPLRIAPGHGPLVDQPIAAIQKLIDRRLKREQEIISHLSIAPQTAQSLTDSMYKHVAPQAKWAALKMIEGHLRRIESLKKCRPLAIESSVIWEVIP